MQSHASYYAEGSVSTIDVNVSGNDLGMMTITDTKGERLFELTASDWQVQDKLGALPHEISVSGKGLLVIEQSPSVNQWLESNSKSALLSKLEGSTRLVLLSIVMVPLCLFGLFKYVLPSVAIVFADYVPDAAIETASKQTVYILEKTMFEASELETETQEAFQDYWLSLSNKVDLESPIKPVNFRSSALGANALALPDGTIYMTDELVELFEYDFELMAAVMLHEIGHVEHRHSMRMIAETLVTTVVLGYVFGDVSGILEIFGGASSVVVQNQFTQKNEWEADNFAIDNLEQVGLPHDAFARAMEKLSQISGEEHAEFQYLQTHPLTSERIENARRLLPASTLPENTSRENTLPDS